MPQKSLTLRLHKIGASAVECGGAGDCCPNSIAYFLKKTGAEVRLIGANFLKSNPERFDGHRHDENDLKAFALAGTYIEGEVELMSIVEGFAEKGDPIVVAIVCDQQDHDHCFISTSEPYISKAKWVFLGFDREGEHYVALKPKKNMGFRCPKSKNIIADVNQGSDDVKWTELISRFECMRKKLVEEKKCHQELPKDSLLQVAVIKVARFIIFLNLILALKMTIGTRTEIPRSKNPIECRHRNENGEIK